MDEIVSDIIRDLSSKQDKIFEEYIRLLATPKIKGEITKGKLKWRGIKMCTYNGLGKTETWIEQRGVQISPKVSFNVKL